jgi:large subunit ribosomal protein L13
MAEMVIDAAGCVAGRLASSVAKLLLKGNTVNIINAEKAVISGRPDYTEGALRERLERGDPYHGPFQPRLPDQLLRRMIRGMMPYRKPRGREAFKSLKVYISVPEELKGKKSVQIEEARSRLECKSVTLEKLAGKTGVKKTW